ncbi:MAG TPA: AAA family ATPase [Acidimicrobiales bacterium]|nr:AAA family ATPase [Acidimicrobiales bacterium]
MRAGAAGMFVGREAELAQLVDVLAGLDEGRGGAVVVHGPAGIGKTRLVDEALARVGGLTVFRTSCGELERDVPFACIAAALGLRRSSPDPAVASIASLIGDADRAEVRFRVVDALVDHLEHLALRQRTALVIDDVQRADDGTLLLLRRIVRDAPALAVAVVSTRRPHPTRTEVDDALGPALPIELDALSAADVAQLAEGIVGQAPGAELTSALGGCSGNPLFASELLRALGGEGRIDVTSGTAILTPGAIPADLRSTVLAQLSFLDDAAVEVLRMGSSFGTTFDVGDLALVLDRPTTQILTVLEPALRAGLLDATNGKLAFRHDLVRDAVYDDMPASARQAIHADIARELRAARRPPTDVASHLIRSARPGDISAVEQLRDAARSAAALSTASAADLLERAIDLAPTDHPERPDLALELASLHTASGRVGAAQELARRVLSGAFGPAPTSAAREVLVHAHLTEGTVQHVIETVEELEADEEGSTHERSQRRLMASRAWRDVGAGARAVATGRIAADLASDDDTRCHALWTVALAAADTFDIAPTLAVMPEALELVRRPTITLPTSADIATDYLFTFGAVDMIRPDARALAEQLLGRLEQTGQLALVPRLREAMAWDNVRWGEPERAILHAEAAVRAADELGGARALTLAHSSMAVAFAYLGELDTARAALEAAEREGARAADPDHTMSGLMQARHEVEMATGHPERALAALWHAFEHHRSGDGAMTIMSGQVPPLVRLLLDVGDERRAREVVEVFEAVARRADEGIDHLLGADASMLRRFALQAKGLVDNDPDAALAAIEAHRGPPVIGYFALVFALDDAAALLVRVGRGAEAVPLLKELRDAWAAVGANPHVDDADARLRALGVRRGVRGPRRRPTTGWEALTEAELRVAELVADGLTYREIAERLYLSRRTVESHVARIFTKLGLSSRRDLARLVLDRRQQPGDAGDQL